jgi:hypothetical protein
MGHPILLLVLPFPGWLFRVQRLELERPGYGLKNVCCYHFVMTDVTLASLVCHAPNPVAADVAGETVLMSLERSRCYGLGEIGSEIWSMLRAPVRVAELVEELSGQYDAPPGVIEQDVLRLLAQLAEEGLIQIS